MLVGSKMKNKFGEIVWQFLMKKKETLICPTLYFFCLSKRNENINEKKPNRRMTIVTILTKI